MDPGKRSACAATSSNSPSAADIVAYLDAMCLGGDPSSSSSSRQQSAQQLLQQRYATPTSPLLARAVPPGASLQPSVNPLMHQLQMARQFWPQPPPPQQRYPWEEEESSSSAAAAPAYNPNGVSSFGSAYGRTLSAGASQYQPAVAAPHPSLAPQPFSLSASASQYQPAVASVASSPWTASSSASPSQHKQPFSSPYQSGDASLLLDYYRALTLSELRATQADSLPWMAPPIRRGRTLGEVRSLLHQGPMELSLALFAESSAHVVRLLEEGGEQMRLSVLAGVRRDVHRIMEDKLGHVVFVTLLRVCEGRHGELHAIVEAAFRPSSNGRVSLMRPAKQEYWDTSLKALITAVARYPGLCVPLMQHLWYDGGGLMNHGKGDQLLHYCFTNLRYEDSRVLLKFAVNDIKVMVESASGSRCVVECFANARGDELRDFEQALLNNAVKFAKGEYSNYFVQHALEHGSDLLKERLLDRLMEDVADLSLSRFGSYVVETCFQKTGLLHRVLSAFLGLREAKLVELVQGEFANYVVHKLLDSCRDPFPAETRALARRIERLPSDVLDQMYARKVTRVVKKLFPRHHRMY